jgi:DNA-binding MarR family transcriptional regulator
MTADQRLLEYNAIIKETDELYRDVAKKLGLPDCSFWILYALRQEGGGLTQSEICDSFYQPKQTVNSALKKMEGDGYIILRSLNDRRSKQIHLTERGAALAQKTVDPVIHAEKQALTGLTEAEQNAFIGLFRKYTDLLKTNLQSL